MNKSTLKEAVAEAKRFIKAAEICAKDETANYFTSDGFYGCKATGATRRASMDLTRKLAELRKP